MAVTNYNGHLLTNEIYSSIFNMILSQQVFADNIKGTASKLVDRARVDGGLFGDTKLYYSTDVLRSYAWGNDAEASNLLALYRPQDPKCQAVTLNVFRQIPLTIDNYLSKRAFSTSGAFSTFTSVMLGWMRDTKRVYDATTYNTFLGTHYADSTKQTQTLALKELSLGVVLNSGQVQEGGVDEEATNRYQAQQIAQKFADILNDLDDITRDYNDYGFLRSYDVDNDFIYVWNNAWINKITKLDLPTIFNKDIMDKFGQYKLQARYFGDIPALPTSGNAITADGLTMRSLNEQDVTITGGTKKHLFAGDLIPSGVTLVSKPTSTTYKLEVPYYVENSNIVCKIIHKDAIPYMSSFSVETTFFNPKSLTENHYLTFGHNTLQHLYNLPVVTLKVSIPS